jgi:hypothetical protein
MLAEAEAIDKNATARIICAIFFIGHSSKPYFNNTNI